MILRYVEMDPGAEDEDEEQDTGAYEEVVESEERFTNGLNAEG